MSNISLARSATKIIGSYPSLGHGINQVDGGTASSITKAI